MVTDTVRLVDVDGMTKDDTTGAVVSGSVMVNPLLNPAEILPAASRTHAYAVFEPSLLKVNTDGTEALQPALPAVGALELSVIM